MRLAISNIAWDTGEDDAVAALLRRYGVDAVDIAPGKYFPDPARALPTEISRVRDAWAFRGIQLTGMQALLFGTDGLNLFGPPESQRAMLRHLEAVCRIGSGLGATRLVFGSPRNRDRGGLGDEEAADIAVRFFRRLGDIAEKEGVSICLEPNPARYGCNFMTSTDETARVVAAVGHPAIRMQLDTGALTVNREDPGKAIGDHASLIGHVHASEPDLVPLGQGGTDHRAVGEALSRVLPSHIVSIEMLAPKDERHAVAIERALRVAIRCYRANADEERSAR
jgi:D-psicose/D-tagatose/L-ribulose 3-epimerase